MTMKERMLPTPKSRARHLNSESYSLEDALNIGRTCMRLITLQFIKKKRLLPERQHGFYWKTKGGKRSCASFGQRHAQAHTRTIIQLPISNVVTLTGAKAPPGAKKGSLKSISEPTTHSSIPEPETYPEPPQRNWTDTKSTCPLNTKQRTHKWRPLTCAIIRLEAASVVPRVVAIPVVLIRAGWLGIVSWVESSVRNMRMEVFTPSP